MAGLLVSVRSVEEAQRALAGGAAVIDIKEPARGPLGQADPEIWQAVREAVPPHLPVSAALGELIDWQDDNRPSWHSV
ncbi:MAG TPA: (5-formylfuran-3-yl)methyl phosphate synthase, partial [Isosphaeraceae bacterium]|nr:(5-formylfuran-3-yl)methyl phosphate synthase [Isosphaeraceae bacterium]